MLSPASERGSRAHASEASATRRGAYEQLIAGALGGLTIVASAAPQGAYFPTSWGWAALALGWVGAMAIVLSGRLSLGRLDAAALGCLALFVGWVALSTLWSTNVPATVSEVERDIIYPLGLLAALFAVRRRAVRQLLGGTLAGIVVICLYSLGTRLLPERLGSFDPLAAYRLAAPLGYWNALGIFSAIGALLALGFAVHARNTALRMAAAGTLLVLLPTLYFTFARGPWLAFGFGVLVTVALDSHRLRLINMLIFVGPIALAGVWLSSRSTALTHQNAALSAAEHDGHRLLLRLAILTVAAAVATFLFRIIERRLKAGRSLRRAWACALAIAVCVLLVAGTVTYGSPITLAHKAYRSFTSSGAGAFGQQNLNKRYFSLSSNGRVDLWRAGWSDYAAHPWLGSGAGSYETYWLRHRPAAIKVRDAHSLYLEVLAELGPVGLLLLVAALVIPLAAAIVARGSALVPAASGAYAAFLLHAGVDWDWEMVGVMLPALFCAAAILICARSNQREIRLVGPWRAAVLLAALGVIAFAVVGEIGNSALAASARAAANGDWRREKTQAQKAAAWAPWSAEPLRRVAEAEYSLGRPLQARNELHRALRRDPNDWELWFDLAVSSAGTGRRHALQRALELNPLSPEVTDSLSTLGFPSLKTPPAALKTTG